MNRYSYKYKKIKERNLKKIFKLAGFATFILGLGIVIYVLYPLLSWQLYFAPAFAVGDIKAPIPRSTIINSSTIKSLISTGANTIIGTNYSNAKNWFPNFKPQNAQAKISSYSLSISKLNIKNAAVSTIDNDLGSHLVNYGGTSVPPEKGNAVIFGHSTLPQLFNPNDYKTIFATLHTIKINDEIFVNVEGVIYKYNIYNIIIVDPTDTSIFTQTVDDSYLTLVTCTPPGT
ncbi:MAG: sortase, partial [bacterium]|nr:sortase [bacterium]